MERIKLGLSATVIDGARRIAKIVLTPSLPVTGLRSGETIPGVDGKKVSEALNQKPAGSGVVQLSDQHPVG